MSAVLALALALQAREELVAVPKTEIKLEVVHVPVDGTALRPFALGKCETTWGDFRAFYVEILPPDQVQADGVTRPSPALSMLGQIQMPEDMIRADRPVHVLRWHTAMAYCDWLTALTGRKFRLPTEAEWELAAKSDVAVRARHAGDPVRSTRAASGGKPNALGIQDLLGNVWELCLEPMDPPGYGPVYRGGSWETPPDLLAAGLRSRVLAEWFAADPQLPRTLWWAIGGLSQGMRPALVGDGAAMKASAAYAPKIGVTLKGAVEKRIPLPKDDREKVSVRGSDFYMTVTIEVANGGDRAVEELEVQAYHLDVAGRPHWTEREGTGHPWRPNYSWAYPVLANSAHVAPRKPLAPGESRTFTVDVPRTFDPPELVQEGKFGARVTWVRLAAK